MPFRQIFHSYSVEYATKQNTAMKTPAAKRLSAF